MITSTSNETVKRIRRLQAQRRAREAEERFVAEGLRLLESALDAGARPELVLHAPGAVSASCLHPRREPQEAGDPRAAALLARLAALGTEVLEASANVLEACSDTPSPQGVLAVLPFPAVPVHAGPALVLDRLRDPGNLGTLLRAAAATGAGQVLLAPGCVDAYNPKVVRGAMGAHFVLAVRALDWPAIRTALAGAPVWLAAARGGVAPWQADLRGPLALVVGGEAAGAGAEAEALATGRLTIPLAPGTESLNAAMAGAMLLYEVRRQNESP
jgi:TrmH family RNA methyltransferase